MSPEKLRTVRWLLNVLIFLVVLVTLGQSWRTSAELRDHSKCQAEWNTFLHRAIVAGRGSSTAADQAMDDLIYAVLEAKSAAETRAALERYKTAREEQKKTTRDNPLPPPPKQVCGDL